MEAKNDELSGWKIEFAKELPPIIGNINVQKNIGNGIPYPYTIEDANWYINEMLNADKDKMFAFAIVHDGKLVGSISVERRDNIHSKTAELGYYISEDQWGNGIATNAIGEICDYVFENSDIVRIFAEPFSHNLASCKTLEKNGFLYEGTPVKNCYKDGRFFDMKMYAKIKE